MWIVNENIVNERMPGDACEFESLSDVLEYYEFWFAEERHLIFDERGNTYKFIRYGDRLAVVSRPDLALTADERHKFEVHFQKYNKKGFI